MAMPNALQQRRRSLKITSALLATIGLMAGWASSASAAEPERAVTIVLDKDPAYCLNAGNLTPGATLTINPCHSQPAMHWDFVLDGSGRLRVDSSKLCIEAGFRVHLRLQECNDDKRQMWRYTSTHLLENAPAWTPRQCFDDPFGFVWPGVEIVTYDCSGGDNQRWTLRDHWDCICPPSPSATTMSRPRGAA